MEDTISASIDEEIDSITSTTHIDVAPDIGHYIDNDVHKSFELIVDAIYDQIPEIVEILLTTETPQQKMQTFVSEKKDVIKTQHEDYTVDIKRTIHSHISDYRQSFINYKNKILNHLYDTRKSVAEHRKTYEICARQRENERIRVLVTKMTSEHDEIVSKLTAEVEEYTTGYHVVRDRNAEYIMENARLSEIIIGLEEKNTQLEAALVKAQNQIKELETKKSRPGKRLTMKKPSRSIITKSHSLDAYAQKIVSGNSTPESSRRSIGSKRPTSRGVERRESRVGLGTPRTPSTPERRERRESRANIGTPESRERRESRAIVRETEERERRSSELPEHNNTPKESKPPVTGDNIGVVNISSLQTTSIDTSSASTLTMLPHDISGIVEGVNEDHSVKLLSPKETQTEPIMRNHTETSNESGVIDHAISEESVITTPSIDRSVMSEDRETEMSREYGSQDYEDGSAYGESEYGEVESIPTDRPRRTTEATQKLQEYENVIRLQKQEIEASEGELATLRMQLSELMEQYTAQELEVKHLKDEIVNLREVPHSSRSSKSHNIASIQSEIDDNRPITSNADEEEVRFFNITSTRSLQSFASKESIARREQLGTFNARGPDTGRGSVASDEMQEELEEQDSFAEHSISVPNTARSHRLSTPIQPVATRFMGGEADTEPTKVEVDVYNMLKEAVNVQRRLESELLQSNKERAELQAKISSMETYTANQDFLYKLKLRERGILLKELSDQVNELRQHVIRDRKIIAEKNRSLPSLGKPLREKSPISKQEVHLFKLELSLDDVEVPAPKSCFPTVTSGFAVDNQTAVVRPMSSGYPKNISQSLKELVGSTTENKKPSMYASSGGHFGKVKVMRPATTAIGLRSVSPPGHNVHLLDGLTDVARQNKVKSEIASVRKQIAELVLAQETELRKQHKPRKTYPL